MRIGQVSRQYGISVDNLYYYIKFGLLVPPRPKGQYVFDEQTIQDLEWILELKDLDFSLQEIHQILSLYRVSALADAQDREEMKNIYRNKREACIQEKERREQMIQTLDRKILELTAAKTQSQEKIGLPVNMLDNICCPNCKASMQICEVDMNMRFIFAGSLSCSCGYQAKIEEGILLTPNKNKSRYDKPDVTRELYKDLPPSLISLFQRSYNWMTRKLEQLDVNHKIVMESYVNAWFFMHNHLQYLSPKAKYIVVDKFPETLRMYKELIEKQNYGLDILYIADSSTNLPLKEGCVDIHLDFFAANEHNFYQHTFLFHQLKPYFAPQAVLLGTYFYFENGLKSMKSLLYQYPECYEKNFNLTYFLQQMEEHEYHILDREDCGYTKDSGVNLGFGFHVKGEKMHLMPYLAKRQELIRTNV